jgi:hypothetical protein
MRTVPPPIPSKFFQGMPKVFLVLLIAIPVILLTMVVSFTIWRWRLHREINTRIDRIQKAGFPVNWVELSKWPSQVAESENAALIYTNAIGHLHTNSVMDNYRFMLPPRGEPLSNEMRSVATSAVRTNQEALEIAYTASKLSKSRYPLEYADGPNMNVAHLAGLKRIVKLLDCQAVFLAETRDADGAARAIESSLNVARSLDNEPILISQLTASGLLTISCGSLERVLCRIPLSDEWLSKLSGKLNSVEATNRFLTGLIGERAFDGEIIRLAQDDVRQMITIANRGAGDEEKTDMPRRNPGIGWRFLGFFERDRNFFLRAMETNILVAATMPPASLSLTNEADRLDAQARGGYYIFSSLLLPGLSHTVIRDASTRATLRVALTAVAVERWRLAHSAEIPDSLETLVPAILPSIPTDPFDGQPLRFKRLARGYVIYSVGPDRQDDGGRERPQRFVKVPTEQRNRYDITFTVER